MTSATIRQARGASRGEGYGMVVFAAVLLGVVWSPLIIAVDSWSPGGDGSGFTKPTGVPRVPGPGFPASWPRPTGAG